MRRNFTFRLEKLLTEQTGGLRSYLTPQGKSDGGAEAFGRQVPVIAERSRNSRRLLAQCGRRGARRRTNGGRRTAAECARARCDCSGNRRDCRAVIVLARRS